MDDIDNDYIAPLQQVRRQLRCTAGRRESREHTVDLPPSESALPKQPQALTSSHETPALHAESTDSHPLIEIRDLNDVAPARKTPAFHDETPAPHDEITDSDPLLNDADKVRLSEEQQEIPGWFLLEDEETLAWDGEDEDEAQDGEENEEQDNESEREEKEEEEEESVENEGDLGKHAIPHMFPNTHSSPNRTHRQHTMAVAASVSIPPAPSQREVENVEGWIEDLKNEFEHDGKRTWDELTDSEIEAIKKKKHRVEMAEYD
ncbi:hypothetical protein DFH06DRAFT_1139038 [Mycena polygramma]|nr:hypothetical protein DFH06DRAFT_1139038 [Mycena polygramma]